MTHFYANKTIVLPYDSSEGADAAVDEALSLADESTRVCVVHVLIPLHMLAVEPGIIFDLGSDEERIASAVAEMERRVPARDDRKIEYTARIGDPGTEIAVFAKQVSADLIVMSSHGRSGLSRLLLGSVAERVLRLAECPVLVVRGPKHA
jgi:nucleotide-binding universal stress UspA family protein